MSGVICVCLPKNYIIVEETLIQTLGSNERHFRKSKHNSLLVESTTILATILMLLNSIEDNRQDSQFA